jgi:hypothetical protein
MPKMIPGRKYTQEQVREIVDTAEAADLIKEGYVLQHDVMDQTFTLVHFTQASSPLSEGSPVTGQGVFEPLDPIQKRTAQQRVDSLMLRFIDDCRAAGTVPGLDDARISAIVGEAWVSGRTEITAGVVRMVAASLLQEAENKRNADNYKKVVTPSPND